MIIDEEAFMQWQAAEASKDDLALLDRVDDFSEYFEDMCFKSGTSSYDLVKCQTTNDSGEWYETSISLPEELEDFDYSWFRYKVRELSDCVGYFSQKESTLCVSPDADDATVLHEMIHLHESVINEMPLYIHDMLYWALYRDLKDKIPLLDEIITRHAHFLTESDLYTEGGLHDILFLLKSFDLDIRMNYPLGTVFGYGKIDDFKGYKYRLGQS